MGFAWAPTNVNEFRMAEMWDFPVFAPKHRKPSRRRRLRQALGKVALRVATAPGALLRGGKECLALLLPPEMNE